MTPYEKALDAVVGALQEATGSSPDELPCEWTEEAIAKWVLDCAVTTLSADGPVVVVDGKVAGLDRVVAIAEWQSCDLYSAIERAAREVAE